MRKILYLSCLIVAFVGVCLFCSHMVFAQGQSSMRQDQANGNSWPWILLRADKNTYHRGEKIIVLAHAENKGEFPITLAGNTRFYDFYVAAVKNHLGWKHIKPSVVEFFDVPVNLTPGTIVPIAKFVFSSNDIEDNGWHYLFANVGGINLPSSVVHLEIYETE